MLAYTTYFARSNERSWKPRLHLKKELPYVIFRLSGGSARAGSDHHLSWAAEWSKLQGILINIVFACLCLGVEIQGFSKVWKSAGLQLAYGQIVAWGQHVVGIGLVLFLLGPLFHLNPPFGAILPVGFEGGHGPVYDELDWSAGKDFALASTTAGIVSTIIVGMTLVN